LRRQAICENMADMRRCELIEGCMHLALRTFQVGCAQQQSMHALIFIINSIRPCGGTRAHLLDDRHISMHKIDSRHLILLDQYKPLSTHPSYREASTSTTSQLCRNIGFRHLTHMYRVPWDQSKKQQPK
jgi:hypothetical protein